MSFILHRHSFSSVPSQDDPTIQSGGSESTKAIRRTTMFAALFLLCPTSDASPRVVDCNLQRPLEHDLCISLQIGDILKDICLQTDEPWIPHAVHKHAAFTTMFSCSIVSCLSLFAYLLLPHPWYVRPVRKGTSDIEPGIPDSFNCPTSHMRQKSKQENQVEFVWLSWMQLS